ncbi:MAG: transcriptional repressor [Deltaproteobacteria bacterium]|nr:MAG: transcriptional repressor [Deltaproteobacteria bacterium]
MHEQKKRDRAGPVFFCPLDREGECDYSEKEFQFNLLSVGDDSLDEIIERIEKELRESGKKSSRTRRKVIEVFFSCGGHLSVEDLYREVKQRYPDIGYVTVYRTLKVLEELGYATSLDVGDGSTRFETALRQHHDHLICTVCGRIYEFFEPEIEVLQNLVARKNDFRILDHTLHIFGICKECQK